MSGEKPPAPTVGRIVHYHSSEKEIHEWHWRTILPAVITYIHQDLEHGEGRVNLQVIGDDPFTYHRRGVLKLNEYTCLDNVGAWSWPPKIP